MFTFIFLLSESSESEFLYLLFSFNIIFTFISGKIETFSTFLNYICQIYFETY
jgi:hypothetical protein